MLQAIPGFVVLCQAVGSDVYTDMIYLFDPVCMCLHLYLHVCVLVRATMPVYKCPYVFFVYEFLFVGL